MLLHHFAERTIDAHPDAEALTCDGRRYDYATIGNLVGRLAATLKRRGVARGDRVFIFSENRLEAVIGIYAALKIGAVFVPVNPLTKSPKLAFLLQDAGPTCLMASAALQPVYRDALRGNDTVRTCIIFGGAGDVELEGRASLTWDQALESSGGLAGDLGVIDQDLAGILYTSGSTGEPRGVMLTHLNMVTAATSVMTYLDLRGDDVILCVLPLAFDYGLYQILMAFAVGARVVLERSFAFPVKTLEVLERERVSVLPGVPTMFVTLVGLDILSRYDLSRLRLITNTAAALSERHIGEVRKAFPGARLFSMYGLTECQRVSFLPPEELDRRPTSVGRGMPNEEVFLIDERGRRLPPGSTGELVVRGSHVMRGYWGKPEESARRLRPGALPGEVLLHTGDLFRMDDEGFLYFLGRQDDIIKSRGEKVSPREVEGVLCGLEGVMEAAVIGVPDPYLGQSVKAFVKLKPGYDYSEKEVVKHCLSRLESYMAPRQVEFRRELPHTDTGKIKKGGLS